MRPLRNLLLPVAGGLMLGSSALAADADHPTLVELFQSQGCSSCPPANAVLNSIADRPDVLALSFAVTYWDQLGWKDSFAHPAFTARQWEYARAGGRTNVFTPQMIVNGKGVLVGGRRAEVEAAIRRYDRGTSGPVILVENGRASIGRGKATRPANVWLVRYDPRLHKVAVRAGENEGRTLPHRNIVHEMHLLGTWRGGAISFAIPASRDGALRSALLVQDGPGGAILSARKI